jgi:membrane-associated protein
LSTLFPIIITWLQFYGYPVLWLCVFVAAIGIPLPISLLLLSTGAFAALGDFNLVLIFITSWSASVCGDSAGYWIGYKIGPGIINWLSTRKRVRIFSPKVLDRSRDYFQSKGGWAVFLSRCLLPALGGVINILAGAERYPYKKFLLADAAGEALGTFPTLMLGFLFGTSWDAVGDLITNASILILLVIIAIYLARLLIRTLQRMKTENAQVLTKIDADTSNENESHTLPPQWQEKNPEKNSLSCHFKKGSNV